MTVPTAAWVRGLPKAQLHVHLEGCIPPALVLERARDTGRDDLARGVPDLSGGLGPFLAHLDRSCAVMDAAEHLERIAAHASRTALAEGVVHTEAIVNPTHWPAWAGRLTEFVDAFDRGFARAEAEGAPWTQLSLSIKRTQSTDEALALVRWIIDARHPRVGALSIDGNEAAEGRTADRFAPAFALAKEHGIPRTVHAGESSGPEGVLDAITRLHAQRIDHGIRAIEDPDTVAFLVAQDPPIALDVCPRSNRVLGAAPVGTPHPAGALHDAGVRLTVGTDDPELFGSPLTSEYLALAEEFGWGRDVLAGLARDSIEASFVDEETRQLYLDRLANYLDGA
ncbi:adenosine deaminase family protein [Demequina sp. NBRC 110054]|uniref:adenosine deaminase family protein n=1 Tax=Demequina sp. NBRC 110054 TaxID=1570343 RepID=UPI000A075E99|nr:adenosine deaminase family protein [Demequina sp. NBRC 110054]